METFEEAIEMVKEAIEAFVESRLEIGYPVPDDNAELEKKSTTTHTISNVNELATFMELGWEISVPFIQLKVIF